MPRLAVLAPHVVQYHVPIYRELARRNDLETHVFYEASSGLDSYYIADFGREVSWDIDLVGGYSHTFLRNRGTAAWGGFLSRVNPALWGLLSACRLDAVLIQGYATLSDTLAMIRSRLGRVRVLYRGENVLEGRGPSPSGREVLKRGFLRGWLRQCDTIFYSCAGNRRYYEHYGADPGRMRFMPCCVDNAYFQQEAERYRLKRVQVRSEIGLKRDDFAVCMSAKLMSLKRPYDLLAAIARLGCDDIVAVFVGDGPERTGLERRASELGVRAVFAGFVNQGEIGRWYTAVDAAAVISAYDASPKAVNEAMNFALPIIASEVIGLAGDLVVNGETGLIVPVSDIDAIADALRRLSTNKELRASLGHAALSRVSQWGPERAAAAIAEAVTCRP